MLLVEIGNNLEDYIFRVVCFYIFFEKYLICKINKFILDLKVFGLYSLRSGGVIVVVEKNVFDCFIKIYGWWKIDYCRDNYIKVLLIIN